MGDPGLLRMQFQAMLHNPRLEYLAQVLRLGERRAVADGIVGEPLERDGGIMLLHPAIKAVGRSEIAQDRRDETALDIPLRRSIRLPSSNRHGCR